MSLHHTGDKRKIITSKIFLTVSNKRFVSIEFFITKIATFQICRNKIIFCLLHCHCKIIPLQTHFNTYCDLNLYFKAPQPSPLTQRNSGVINDFRRFKFLCVRLSFDNYSPGWRHPGDPNQQSTHSSELDTFACHVQLSKADFIILHVRYVFQFVL